MTMTIHITNIKTENMPQAVHSIADFLNRWSHLHKVEIILEEKDC